MDARGQTRARYGVWRNGEARGNVGEQGAARGEVWGGVWDGEGRWGEVWGDARVRSGCGARAGWGVG